MRARRPVFQTQLAAFKRELIAHYLKAYDGNISKTARALGMPRAQLHRLMTAAGMLHSRTGATCPKHPDTVLVRGAWCPACRGTRGGLRRTIKKTRAARLNAARPRPRGSQL